MSSPVHGAHNAGQAQQRPREMSRAEQIARITATIALAAIAITAIVVTCVFCSPVLATFVSLGIAIAGLAIALAILKSRVQSHQGHRTFYFGDRPLWARSAVVYDPYYPPYFTLAPTLSHRSRAYPRSGPEFYSAVTRTRAPTRTSSSVQLGGGQLYGSSSHRSTVRPGGGSIYTRTPAPSGMPSLGFGGSGRRVPFHRG
ncbi:MAG: hypothetical protein JSS32_05105 [Verrucomicrobia bacterium]|nr:hypothetical protein [Verrucomicrobiota bacterium]